MAYFFEALTESLRILPASRPMPMQSCTSTSTGIAESPRLARLGRGARDAGFLLNVVKRPP